MARTHFDLRHLSARGRPHPRLFARARFGRTPEWLECIVDTGAPYPILLGSVWRDVAEVRATVDLEPAPSALPTLDVAGRQYSFRWGRLPVTLLDWHSLSPLPPVMVVCKLCVARLDKSSFPDLSAPVLGLGGGLFDGRYLVLTPGPAPAAWVQDVPPA
jgi:hypothetical protein